MPIKLLPQFRLLNPSLPVTLFPLMKLGTSPQSFRAVPFFSRIFPLRLRYSTLGSRSIHNEQLGVLRRFSTRQFRARAVSGSEFRAGRERGVARAPKSLIDDEAELSDWVSELRTDKFRGKLTSEDEALPARHLSSSASFSKFRRPSLKFEDDPSTPVFDSESQVESSGTHRLTSGLVSQESKGEAVNTSNPVKRHPILIGGNAPQPPVKLRKCGNEGNFVRLNLNRSKRRFLNKGSRSRNSHVSGGRKYYRKRRRKLEGEGEPQKSTYEEDGLVVESVQQKQRKESQSENSDSKLIEEVVSVTRNESSDENLVKLLKVMYGYDSFRDGQLDAIKMVLAGESVMLVLPTGAGKSDSYLSETRFDQCTVSPLSLKGINDAGYEKMTVVQEATLPVILKDYSETSSCRGIASAHNMAIKFRSENLKDLSVPLLAVVQFLVFRTLFS